MKSTGNLPALRFTASLKRFVGTSYSAAKSESRRTCPLRSGKIRFAIESIATIAGVVLKRESRKTGATRVSHLRRGTRYRNAQIEMSGFLAGEGPLRVGNSCTPRCKFDSCSTRDNGPSATTASLPSELALGSIAGARRAPSAIIQIPRASCADSSAGLQILIVAPGKGKHVAPVFFTLEQLAAVVRALALGRRLGPGEPDPRQRLGR